MEPRKNADYAWRETRSEQETLRMRLEVVEGALRDLVTHSPSRVKGEADGLTAEYERARNQAVAVLSR